ncbi:MAG: 50S ribosomal protein L15 [Chlamydiales bacterium]|nr:50S ribosomal protein L15 [Chlamydiia bacterium]MCP5506886.1 50S ribosomal protein L15 [Chlamydiales bacterium]
MSKLASLKNTSRPKQSTRRVGRGLGCKRGKTCGRGTKGQGARSGYKRRYGREGGQFPLHMKLPIRGFSNARFRKTLDSINLSQIDKIFNDGDTVNLESLRKHGIISGKSHGLKILGNGELTKKVKIEAYAISEGAREKLQQAKIDFTVLSSGQ